MDPLADRELASGKAKPIKAPSKDTPNIQEIHTIIGHEVCKLVEKKIFDFK